MRKKILYSHFKGIIDGGSDHCLFTLLSQIDQSKYEPYLLYKNKNEFLTKLENIGIKTLPFFNKEMSTPLSNNLNLEINNNDKLCSNELKGILVSIKRIIKKIPEIIRFVKILSKNNIDIVHANHNLKGDQSIILAAIILRKKIVSHNRGLYIPNLVDRYMSKKIDKIISVSNFSNGIYIKNGIKKEKCVTIYDGIDTNKFKILNENIDSSLIGCIGRIERWKGQQVLVEAAKSIIRTKPDAKFIFVGDGSNKAELIKLVKKSKLDKSFAFTGAVSDVIKYIEKCSIIVHTSIEPEPFGMVIIESMALGKPVIATNFGGPSEIISNEKDGLLIPPNQPAILSAKIKLLMEDETLRKQIGLKARETIVNNFNYKSTTNKIQQIYTKIFSGENL